MFPHRKWIRHTAMVPKGFIRYHVLEALNEKSMSGSELMEEIEKHTGGLWKPSPGSIYPLLSWLQDSGYVKELPVEIGLKRYELTHTGKELLEEQREIQKKLREEVGFPGFPGGPISNSFLMKIPAEKMVEVRETMKRLALAMFKIGGTLGENYSEKALDQALAIVKETSERLEQINSRLKGEKNE